MKLISILLLSTIFISTALAQRDFVCELKERKGEFAKSGMRMTLYTFDKKKPFQVERVQDTLYVVKDTLGNIIKDKLRNFITKTSQLVVFQNYEGKWGVLRKDMTTLIEDKYDDLTFEGVGTDFNCLVKKNKLWGIIDSTNNKILPIKYSRIQLLNRHLAFLEKKGKKYLFFLEDRKMVKIKNFCVKGISTNDTQEQFLIQKDGLVGMMDNKGQTVIKPEFDDIQYMQLDKEGLVYYYLVNKNKKKGVIDKKGNILIPVIYENVLIKNRPKTMNKAAFVLIQNNVEYLYYNGKIANQKFQKIEFNRSTKDAFIFNSLNRFGLYDYVLDKVLIEPIYNQIKTFNDSIYFANKDGKFGIITANNQTLLAFEYDEIPEYIKKSKYYPTNYYKVRKNGMYGYVNDNFQTVLAPKYHVVRAFAEDLARVMKDYKWGYLDEAFNEQIALKFDHAEAFKDGEAKVILNGKEFFINKKGECIRGCK